LAHYPVLLPRVLEFLNIDPSGLYVDCTLGESRYAEAILSRLDSGRLIAIDWDRDAIELARGRLREWSGRVSFHHTSYGDIEGVLGTERPQGIVADLGLSRRQFEAGERGFSLRRKGPLDMRMDRRRPLTADVIVNQYDERRLADLIFEFGEERRSRRIAKAIVRGRPIRDTAHLAEIVAQAVPRTPRMKIHPATRTFQAIRIAVNDELAELDRLVEAAPPLLAPGGRMVVVSFHSLEDRRVKQSFRRWADRDLFALLTKRVVRPGEDEVAENPASRSAKLRAAERTTKLWQPLN
jgi:16S rRNA (cytosine1402-N4)-methyltransferase